MYFSGLEIATSRIGYAPLAAALLAMTLKGSD
jgi:hypothetical protein